MNFSLSPTADRQRNSTTRRLDVKLFLFNDAVCVTVVNPFTTGQAQPGEVVYYNATSIFNVFIFFVGGSVFNFSLLNSVILY